MVGVLERPDHESTADVRRRAAGCRRLLGYRILSKRGRRLRLLPAHVTGVQRRLQVPRLRQGFDLAGPLRLLCKLLDLLIGYRPSLDRKRWWQLAAAGICVTLARRRSASATPNAVYSAFRAEFMTAAYTPEGRKPRSIALKVSWILHARIELLNLDADKEPRASHSDKNLAGVARI